MTASLALSDSHVPHMMSVPDKKCAVGLDYIVSCCFAGGRGSCSTASHIRTEMKLVQAPYAEAFLVLMTRRVFSTLSTQHFAKGT